MGDLWFDEANDYKVWFVEARGGTQPEEVRESGQQTKGERPNERPNQRLHYISSNGRALPPTLTGGECSMM